MSPSNRFGSYIAESSAIVLVSGTVATRIALCIVHSAVRIRVRIFLVVLILLSCSESACMLQAFLGVKFITLQLITVMEMLWNIVGRYLTVFSGHPM